MNLKLSNTFVFIAHLSYINVHSNATRLSMDKGVHEFVRFENIYQRSTQPFEEKLLCPNLVPHSTRHDDYTLIDNAELFGQRLIKTTQIFHDFTHEHRHST